MKQSKFIIALSCILLLSTAFATPVVRGGVRGNSVAFGLEEHNLSASAWQMGYGGELTTGAYAMLGYLSFNKIIGQASYDVPLYLSFGPAVGIGNGVNIGGFAHLGFDKIFDTQTLFAEIGVDAMTLRGGTGLCLELGYRF